jgi:hypothetical protein
VSDTMLDRVQFLLRALFFCGNPCRKSVRRELSNYTNS